jgi:flagellar FliL protein
MIEPYTDYHLEVFTINILSETGRRYIKADITLNGEGKDLSSELDQKKEVLRDVIIRVLSAKSFEDYNSKNAKQKIKNEIQNEINMRLHNGKIIEIRTEYSFE